MSELQTPEKGTEIPDEQPVAPSAVNAPETPVTPSEPAPQEPEPLEPAPEPTDPDYKQKFVDSQREAILLAERNKVKEAQIEKLTKTDTPTDEAMRLVYPDWDTYNDIAKKAFIRQESQEMRQRAIEARQEELDNRLKQDEEIQSQTQSNPKLQGKESEFKRFALNPKNKGISADVLAKAFLFDVEPEAIPAAPTEALPTGSGGPRGDLTPKKMSIEDAAQLRKTDSKRYMELAKAGLIDDDI
jgi:hypothetical protein